MSGNETPDLFAHLRTSAPVFAKKPQAAPEPEPEPKPEPAPLQLADDPRLEPGEDREEEIALANERREAAAAAASIKPDPASDVLPEADAAPQTAAAPPEPPPAEAEAPSLFGELDQFTSWWAEWVGMPEFCQEDIGPWKSLMVHFESRVDMEAFAKLVEQTITYRTRSVWYPKAEIGRFSDKRYIEERKEKRR